MKTVLLLNAEYKLLFMVWPDFCNYCGQTRKVYGFDFVFELHTYSVSVFDFDFLFYCKKKIKNILHLKKVTNKLISKTHATHN